jgi:hypothetical protein
MAKVGKFDISIGCDPEFFVVPKGSSEVVSAHGLIEGTKREPLKVKGGAVQVDGMALEFNIDPASNEEEFKNNIDEVLAILREMTPGYDFLMEPVAHFGKDYIDSQPLEARTLGCDPDYNAYTNSMNPVPDKGAPFRTASGHVHISWKDTTNPDWPDTIDPFTPSHIDACNMLVKTLDAYLGIPSIAIDQDVERRQLYGKAGSYRPKSYGNGWLGLEYRVLSNKWLNYPWWTSLIYNNTLEAFQAIFDDYKTPERLYGGKTAQWLVDNANLPEVEQIVKRIYKRETIKSSKYYRLLEEEKKAA